tara:strand:+ start:684 stop:1007 length:324 start_codon:yes stop_codon:yes gene_type:complete
MEAHKFKDIRKFSLKIGKFVARSAGYTIKELRSFINVSNVEGIVRNHATMEEDYFTLSEKQAENICDEILDWLVGVEIAKMAAEDKLDCYWDDEINEMVFKGKVENE